MNQRRLSMKGWLAAALLAAVLTATLLALVISREASPSVRRTSCHTDYLGGSSSGSAQCTSAQADRRGGWACYATPAP